MGCLGLSLSLFGCTDDCPPNGDSNSFFCQGKDGSGQGDAGVDGGGSGNGGTLCPEGHKPGDACSAAGGERLTCSPSLRCTCGNGSVEAGEQCDGGADCDASCRIVCATDDDCDDATACHSGGTCDQGTKRCNPGTRLPTGSQCRAGGSCDEQGNCLSCALEGSPCQLSNACETGVVTCAGGTPRCASQGPVDAGEACGDGRICDGQGQCVGCERAGQNCQPQNACLNGSIECDAELRPRCTAGSASASGKPCPGGQCNAGECVPCADGGSGCVPTECWRQVECPPNVSGCVPRQPVPTGTACGEGGYCDGAGTCVVCGGAGQTCRPGSDCVDGVVRCTDIGRPVCAVESIDPSGTQCGSGGTCDRAGTCIECSAAGNMCTPAEACFDAGVVECRNASSPACKPTRPSSLGSACSANGGQFCDGAGMCTTCDAANASCIVPTAVCRKGQVACVGGQPACQESGFADPGTPCGSGHTCNAGGQCVACSPSMTRENTAAACSDGVDNDCDGRIDGNDRDCTNLQDRDGDSWCPLGRDRNGDGDCFDEGEALRPDEIANGARGDCDDHNAQRNPGRTEICDNGFDDNCNGLVDAADPACGSSYGDGDRDGWCPAGRDRNGDGDCLDGDEPFRAADLADGTVRGDCDDRNRWRSPGLREICDGGTDNDCRAETVEEGTGGACAAARDNNCYLRFRDVNDQHSAYLMCVNHVEFWRAKDACGRSGMNVVRVDDAEENSWIWHTYHDIVEGQAPRNFLAAADWQSGLLHQPDAWANAGGGAVNTLTYDARWDKGEYWIGLYDTAPSAPGRGWKTEPGWYVPTTPAPYTNWAQGDPSNQSSRCVRVVHARDDSRNKQWTDRNCDAERFKFICERY